MDTKGESEAMTEEERVEQLWSSVPYHDYGRIVAPAAADLVEFVGVSEGDELLDVACGTGNTAVTAARQGADVTGVDLNDDMLEGARENVTMAGLNVDLQKGDATDLPVADDSYDVTLSSFGHHLTSDPVTATEELVRVTHPGGRVGFAAYALDGCVGDAYRALARHHPKGDDVVKPFYWGDEEFVRKRFGEYFDGLAFDRGEVHVHGLSPTHIVEHLLDITGSLRIPFEQAADQDALYDVWTDITEKYFERNRYSIEYVLARGTV